jgi:hypothetical protein
MRKQPLSNKILYGIQSDAEIKNILIRDFLPRVHPNAVIELKHNISIRNTRRRNSDVYRAFAGDLGR